MVCTIFAVGIRTTHQTNWLRKEPFLVLEGSGQSGEVAVRRFVFGIRLANQ